MATFDFCDVEMIPMGQLELDPRFNRELIESTINAIDADPDPDKFGVIQAARLNGNGKYTVYDGGHRFAWLQRIGYDGTVPVAVGRMTDPHVLAVKFVELNTTRRPVSPWERYRKLLFAEDPMYVAIDRAVTSAGWKVGPKATEYTIMPAPLVRLYKAGGEEAIKHTLDLTHEMWHGAYKATDGNLLDGIWRVIDGLGDGLDFAKFVQRLTETNPHELLDRAADRRVKERGSLSRNVEVEILRIYRARRSGDAVLAQVESEEQ